ncbi:gamma interferon inducible lysosomal thiol reductase (GILT), putative [Paecilomyces variotii No. 5]|uniref:Gamma interferon inducible lysosomal thiol reductase (GILT), putative n=1 Tax=Byssochlamys spectabilis (strain No. 5 / NBRC 109023) TaxID=1356009 RepID=V5F7E7_BYSSN|nr:gamma interferon inducible lysosomal thiol reductase (GILT), putative [Paecilomyces variotii No. 5]
MEKSAPLGRSQNDLFRTAAPSTSASFRTRRDHTISRIFRRALTAVCFGLVIYIFVDRFSSSHTHAPTSSPKEELQAGASGKRPNGNLDTGDAFPLSSASSNRVPLEAHIMSKCPDAQDCLQQLIVPAMERVNDKVDFILSFIASVSEKTSEVDCKHGPAECIGNMLMLCAANLPFPPNDNLESSLTLGRTPTIRWLGFSNCLIGSYEEIPKRDLVEDCALEHGIDFDALNHCASQQDDQDPSDKFGDAPLSGIALLRESAQRSAQLGVTTSCTVRVNDSIWCIRDGGVWKDCAKDGEASNVSVLVDEVERLYKERN